MSAEHGETLEGAVEAALDRAQLGVEAVLAYIAGGAIGAAVRS